MDNTQFEYTLSDKGYRILIIQFILNDTVFKVTDDLSDISDALVSIYNRVAKRINTEPHINTTFGYYEKIISNDNEKLSTNNIIISVSYDDSISVKFVIHDHTKEDTKTTELELPEELANEIVNKTILFADIYINNKERFYSDEYIKF